jgi:hypothetical protein
MQAAVVLLVIVEMVLLVQAVVQEVLVEVDKVLVNRVAAVLLL